MKTKFTNSFKVSVLLLIYSLALFSACKKGKNGSPDEPYNFRPTSLYGNSWSALPHVDGVDNLLAFNADSTFIRAVTTYPQGNATFNSATGRYHVKGDSVSFTITERKNGVYNGAVTTTTVNEKLYEKATYKIQGFDLIITYTDSSSGTPVTATAKFTFRPLAL